MKRHVTLISGVLAASLIVGATTNSAARDEDAALPVSQWEAYDGGVFTDPANWSFGNAPGNDGIARFGLGGDVTVTLDRDAEIASLQIVDGGTTLLTFDLNGHTLRCTSDDVGDAGFEIRSDDPDQRTLRLVNGIIDASTVRFGQGGSDILPSVLEIGEGGIFRQRGDTRIPNAGGKLAEVRIEPGGRLESSHLLELARGAGTKGTLSVVGQNAVADFQPEGAEEPTPIYVGFAGDGTVKVRDGGVVRGAGLVELGRDSERASGTIEVSGAESRFEAASIYVGGRSPGGGIAAGSGLLQVATGGVIETGRVRVFERGVIFMEGGALRITKLRLDPGSTLRVALSNPDETSLQVAGGVHIDAAKLEVVLPEGFSAQTGEVFPILGYSELSQDGMFDERTDGSVLESGGYRFAIHYGGGKNHFISLEVRDTP